MKPCTATRVKMARPGGNAGRNRLLTVALTCYQLRHPVGLCPVPAHNSTQPTPVPVALAFSGGKSCGGFSGVS